jgi:hypothetical protein
MIMDLTSIGQQFFTTEYVLVKLRFRGERPFFQKPFHSEINSSGLELLTLTDMGATTLLPSYVVDIWVSGSDASGNPFETLNNNIDRSICIMASSSPWTKCFV